MVEGARTAVVIDDDPDVRTLLRVALETTGFIVDEAMTGHGGVDRVRVRKPDLVTLDLVLPGFGGIEVCRRIRQISDAYIIMITGSSDEADRLVGLATGADDYVTKPFSPREVQARVAAMFRRPRIALPGDLQPPVSTGPLIQSSPSVPVGQPAPAVEHELIAPPLPAPPSLGFGPAVSDPPLAPAPIIPAPVVPAGPPEPAQAGQPAPPEPVQPEQSIQPELHGLLRHGNLAVDTEARVAWCDATELALTKIEFDLLVTMISNPRRVWRRETLLNIVWGGQWSDFHVVEVHIGNLRRKLANAASGGGGLIKTVRGIGYRMIQTEPQPPARAAFNYLAGRPLARP